MSTEVLQGGRIVPVGEGIGATQDVWLVMSPARAAGLFSISTEVEPLAIIPGPAGTQLGSMQGLVMSMTRAAGLLLIFTVNAPGGMMSSGSPGCGTGVGVGAGGWIGA